MSQPCNKCQCVINWDKMLNPPTTSSRAKDGKPGWWREDLSKEVHTADRCQKFQGTGEFKIVIVGNTGGSPSGGKGIEPPPKVTTPTSLKPREMDASDFAEKPMRAEIIVHCKFLLILEDQVTKCLPNGTNPAKVGMYMKMVQDMMEKK